MPDPHELSISLQTLDGRWETLGRDRYQGIWPENFQATADAWGPATCSFVLRRDRGAIQPDLSSFTPCRVEVAGLQCWSGRVKETPMRDGPDGVITVQGEGWQYHLDDDVYERVYAHTRLSDWRDQRSFLAADLTTYLGRYQVGSDGGITLLAPGGTGNMPINSKVGVTLDLKHADAKRVVITWERIGAAFDATFVGIGHDAENEIGAAGAAGTNAELLFATGLHVTAGATTATTLTTARRYVTLYWFPFSAVVPAADQGVRITAAKMFSATAYESGNASVLKADQILTDALDRGTLLLNPDRSGIQPGVFSIPEFALDGAHTPREVWAAANAYENYDTKIDADGRPVFRPRPSAPIFEIGEWSGADFEDASANSGDEIYNRALVQGTGPDEAQMTVERVTQEGEDSTGVTQPANPGAEVNTTNWTATKGTLTRDTILADTGVGSFRLTSDVNGETLVKSADVSMPLKKGLRYSVSLARLMDAVARQANYHYRVREMSTQRLLGQTLVPFSDSSQIAGWRVTKISWTQDADAAGYYIEIYSWTDMPAVAYGHQWDSVTVYRVKPTLVDRQGFRRTKILPVNTSIVQASGERLGDLYLNGHKTTPFRGGFTATGQGGIRRVLGGAAVHPAWLLRESGELVRCAHRIDPDTGGWGRTGRTATVSYDHDSLTSTVSLDDDRAGFEALLSRLAVVNG